MKNIVHLSYNTEDSYSVLDSNVDFMKLIPTNKVASILEVTGEIAICSLSAHFKFLALINRPTEEEVLYIVHLKEQKVEAFKPFAAKGVSLLYFLPDDESTFLMGFKNGLLVSFNIENKQKVILEGHLSAPSGVSYRLKSDLLLSWSRSELLIWSWPSATLTKRLKLEADLPLIQAEHAWEISSVVGGFKSGVIAVWDLKHDMEEHFIEVPSGVTCQFASFSLSHDGQWMIGTGSDTLVVAYSLLTRRVSRVTRLPLPTSTLSVDRVQFLPYTQPQYPKIYLAMTCNSIMLIDFSSSCIIKCLQTHSYLLRSFFVSNDGFLLGVLYNNGHVKLYTTLSFLPDTSDQMHSGVPTSSQQPAIDPLVNFKIVQAERKTTNKKIKKLLNADKWRNLLEQFLEYPSDFRRHIWVSLMKLPKNFSVLNELLSKNEKSHSRQLTIDHFSISGLLRTSLKNVLTSLHFWSPSLGEANFLPSFILPFVRLFEADVLLSFEASVFVLMNWGCSWSKVSQSTDVWLSIVAEMVEENDGELRRHLTRIGVSSQIFAWEPLSSAFSQVLTWEDWLVAWDHLLSNPPSFLIAFTASIVLRLRQPLLDCHDARSCQDLLHQPVWVDIQSIVSRSKDVFGRMNLEASLKLKLDTVTYLPENDLPFFKLKSVGSHNKDVIEKSPQISPITLPRCLGSSCAQLHKSKIDETQKHQKPQSSAVPAIQQNSKRNVGAKHLPISTSGNHDLANLKELHHVENNCIERIKNTRKKLMQKGT